MNIFIRNEEKKDYFYVEAMTRYSFWNVYKPGCDEHVIVHKLRDCNDFIPELDYVAECDHKIIGNVMCSKAKIHNSQKNSIDEDSLVAVGPICVLPQWQKKGVASLLMEKVKETAKSLGKKGLVLYGNPDFYHRFGFVDAKKYGITMPDGNNIDAFMVLELSENALISIRGRCFESEAFEVSSKELEYFERKFIGISEDSVSENPQLDYSNIKKEFTNAGVEFPLMEEDCKGLTKEEMFVINPCGTYCGKCEDYGVVCDGCRNRKGSPIWYQLFSKKETCEYYVCTEKNKFHDCSQCQQVPCTKYFDYPDPNMTDEFKQMWFKLRMENFNQLNCIREIKVENTYSENEKMYDKLKIKK